MKNFLTYIAIIVILIVSFVFVSDFGQTQLEVGMTKIDSNKAASTIASFFDPEKYSEGKYVIKDTEAIEIAEDILDGYIYTVHIWDDSLKHRVLTNNNVDNTPVWTVNESFSYPASFTRSDGKVFSIKKPTVVTEIEKKGDYYRLEGVDADTIKRGSMYEVDIRK